MAVWVEDKDGIPGPQPASGSRSAGAGPFQWLPDLKRWYRSDQARKHVDKTDMVYTDRAADPAARQVLRSSGTARTTTASRSPAGEYTVSIDAAREHGTYQSIRKQVTIGDKPFAEELKGNVEIKSASIEYRRKAPAKVATRRRRPRRTVDPPPQARPSGSPPSMRWLHIYLSMFGLAAVLFFSVTGITLNHPDWFFGEAERRVEAEGRSTPSGCTRRPRRPIADVRPPARSRSWRSSSTCARPTASAGPWPSSGPTRPNAS